MTAGPLTDVMLHHPKVHDAGSSVADMRALFDDDHVHTALIVGRDGGLVTTIERADIDPGVPGSSPAVAVGTLVGRTVGPSATVDAVTSTLLGQGRRRLAVVDEAGRLLGLLCLKRDERGYCSDADVRARVRAAAVEPP